MQLASNVTPTSGQTVLENVTISGYIGRMKSRVSTMANIEQWTWEQGWTYETARETINRYCGHVSAAVYAEETLTAPRVGVIAALREHRLEVTRERNSLQPDDDASIAAVIQKYKRLNAAFETPTAAAA